MTKTFRIEPVPASGLVRIAYEGGGEVPDELKGGWTTAANAKMAIAAWQAKNPDRTQEAPRVVTEEQEEKRGPGRPPKAKLIPEPLA